ncbi:MAG TPA: DNA-formamidopyrimidine glycosylase family protein [Acidimicrobiales bacterium]|nr:DNA-formamidopyrimidine glycosylase family protein [Acidimicrobiales bacterium]
MPELPEVEALALFVGEKASGTTIERAELASFSALKTFRPPIEALVGRTVVGATRRGKYLCTDTAGLWLVAHFSRAGWLHWREPVPPARARPGKGPLALRIGLSSGAGFDITEQGTEKRLALWVVAELEEIDGLARLGPDPLASGFDQAQLGKVLAATTGQLKTVLADQSVLAGVGNAYSDEILWAAKLSPFKAVGKLSDDELARLYAALRSVLADAVQRSLGQAAKELKDAKRAGMAVHARGGLACPECGDTVRDVFLANRSFQYCPTCQTGGKVLADRRLSRLLK